MTSLLGYLYHLTFSIKITKIEIDIQKLPIFQYVIYVLKQKTKSYKHINY